MNKKLITGYFMVLMLSLIGFVPTTPNGLAKVGPTTVEMEWMNTYGGTADDVALSIIQTTDEKFVLIGETRSYGSGGKDFWLVKTDAAGQPEWNNTFGGSLDDWAYSIIQTADGGFVLGGITTTYGAGGQDFWLVKTDATGQHEWNNTFGGTADDIFRSMTPTTDGGFALIGGTWSYGAGGQDIWLVKTDANSQPQWNKTYGGTGNERGLSIIQTADSGFAISGGNMLIKTDINGQPEWNTTLGTRGEVFLNALIQTADEGFALAGGTTSYGAGMYDFLLMKTNANGEIELNKTYGGPADDLLYWDNLLVQTTDEGFALAGATKSYGTGGLDYWLVKTDINGQVEWNQTFGETADETANSLIQTKDKGFALAGSTKSYGAGGNDIWLVKTRAYEEPASSTPTETTTSTKSTTPTETTTSTDSTMPTDTTTPTSTSTTAESTPSWTLIIVIMSLTVGILRKRKKRF